ncbi:MAG: hypothetical protein AAF927_32345 [Bacteroidota bacterium]
MFISFIPEYSPSDFAVSHFGPEGEYIVKEQQNTNPRFHSEKHNMILRMLRSDAFVQGQMTYQDIAKVTQVQVKLVKKIYRELSR